LGLDKVSKVFDLTGEAIAEFSSMLGGLRDSLVTGVFAAQGMVDYITRSLYFAFQQDLTAEYKRMKALISTLTQAISRSISLLADLDDAFSVLDDFKALMNSKLFKPFKEFEKGLRGIATLVDKLSFISTIADFQVCLSIPKYAPYRESICIVFVGCATIEIPWVNESCEVSAVFSL
jgi:hypothetical protein